MQWTFLLGLQREKDKGSGKTHSLEASPKLLNHHCLKDKFIERNYWETGGNASSCIFKLSYLTYASKLLNAKALGFLWPQLLRCRAAVTIKENEASVSWNEIVQEEKSLLYIRECSFNVCYIVFSYLSFFNKRVTISYMSFYHFSHPVSFFSSTMILTVFQLHLNANSFDPNIFFTCHTRWSPLFLFRKFKIHNQGSYYIQSKFLAPHYGWMVVPKVICPCPHSKNRECFLT